MVVLPPRIALALAHSYERRDSSRRYLRDRFATWFPPIQPRWTLVLEVYPPPVLYMCYRSLKTVLASLTVLASPELHAQRPTLSTAVRAFVAVDTPIVALTHARVIDGTGASARDDQTLIIRDGRIAAIGASRSVAVPA